jgi:hypothetical protein
LSIATELNCDSEIPISYENQIQELEAQIRRLLAEQSSLKLAIDI